MTATRSTLRESTSSAEFLIDASILIYALDARDLFKLSRAREVLDALVTSKRGALSAQSLSEFYSATQKKPILPRDIAEAAVVDYARAWPVLEVKVEAVLEAVRGVGQYRFSYFDSLMWATAKLNNVPTLFSEDSQHGQLIEGVRRVNPLQPSFNVATLL